MLRFIDLETPPNREEDVQIAGLKPLPINRMVRQAGRRKNKSQSFEGSSLNAGQMMFTRRDSRRIELSPQEAQTLLRSDPQFKRSYEKQVKNGQRSDMTDKYDGIVEFRDGRIITNVYKPYEAGGVTQRKSMPTKDLNQQTLERQQRTKDAINNWDPIEASAKEDYNRLRGGKKPIVNPGALPLADELIQTIETPIAPATSQMDRYGI